MFAAQDLLIIDKLGFVPLSKTGVDLVVGQPVHMLEQVPSGHQPSRLCFVGIALMENRNCLVVDGRLTRASDASECPAAINFTAFTAAMAAR